jgi:hypothetical protein
MFPIRHDSFEIMPANLLNEILAISLDVLGVEVSNTGTGLNQFAQPFLSCNQGKIPQVFTIQPEQIECIENWRAFSRDGFVEIAYAIGIDRCRLLRHP